MKFNQLFNLILLFTIFSCGEDNAQSFTNSDWLIPSSEVQDGGPGKDGIPSIDSPKFSSIDAIDFMSADDLIIGVWADGEIKGYPHPILDWHEIVNDQMGNQAFALTYCPLTGTAINWNRKLSNGETTTFGVSGKLYNNNLIPYDRETDSYWSQINLNCVNGDRVGEAASLFPIIETSWKTWKELFPDAEVLNTNTGFNRNYLQYPYGDYKTNNDRIIFPLSNLDNRLAAKDRVLGVSINDDWKAYPLSLFETPKVIHDRVGGEEIVVIGSQEKNFIVAYKNDNTTQFSIDLESLPIIAKDEMNNSLNILGQINNEQLEQPTSFMGYWFSFGAFYPDIEIYE